MSSVKNPDFARFGEKLRTLRNRHSLTLTQLATELGYKAHGHLSDIETGKKVPSLALVLKVTRFFDVSADVLIRDELEIPD